MGDGGLSLLLNRTIAIFGYILAPVEPTATHKVQNLLCSDPFLPPSLAKSHGMRRLTATSGCFLG